MTDSTLRFDDEESMAWLLPPEDPADVDRWLAGVEERVAEDVRATLRRIVDDVLTEFTATLALTAAGDVSALDVIPGRWAEYVRNDIGDVIGTLHGSGGLSAWFGSQRNPQKNRQIMSEAQSGRWADVMNDAAVDYQRTATNRLVRVGDDLWGDIRAKTVDGLQDGMTNEQIKKEIESITGFTEQRADTIARTETVSAYNAGEFEGAKALGEFGPVEKQWLAANDRRTRESHANADGQVVPMDQPFKVGGVLMQRPHDPGAPAGEVVNCRCVLLLLYPGDTRPDGTEVPAPPRPPTARVTIPDPTPDFPPAPPLAPDDPVEAYKARMQALMEHPDLVRLDPRARVDWSFDVPLERARRSEAIVRQIGAEVDAEARRRMVRDGLEPEYPTGIMSRALVERQDNWAAGYRGRVYEALEDVRPFGPAGDYVHTAGVGPVGAKYPMSTSAQAEAYGKFLAGKAQPAFPTEWNRNIGFAEGKVTYGDVVPGDQRGFSSRAGAGDDEHGVVHIPMERQYDQGLIVHETMHQAETVNINLTGHEWAMIDRRARAGKSFTTDGAPAGKSLAEMTGLNYGPNEVAIDDHFLNAYIGKVYSFSPTANYEVLSMGIEGLWGNKFGVIDGGDSELRDFVLGALAAL